MPLVKDTWATSLTPHGLELYYSGAWQDITADLGDDGVSITRGRRSAEGRIGPAEMNLTLDNSADNAAGVAGTYSPRNPASPLYGLIGRGTPVRYWVSAGDPRLVVPGDAGALIGTPDSAALSIAGELDVRIDLRLDNWRSQCDLLHKWAGTGDQRSWNLVVLVDGRLALYRSSDGTAAGTEYATSEALPPHETGRLSIRVTYDNDNGAGSRVYRFYYSETPGLTGPWTLMGTTTAAGTETTFDSTAPVQVGDTDGQGRFAGEVYSVEILDGIAGTVRASPDFTTATAGASTLVDGQGNTWTVAGAAELTDKHYRFTGEVVAWPQQWSMKGVAYTPIQCAGVTRRMGQGADVLKSAYYRACTSTVAPITSLVGYWPMTDGAQAHSFAPGLPGLSAMGVTGSPNFASDSTSFVASEPLPVLTTGAYASGALPAHTSTGEAQAFVLVKVPDAGPAATADILAFVTTGTAYRWVFQMTTSGGLQLAVYDPTNTLITTIGPVAFDLNGGAWRLGVHLETNGADIDTTMSALAPGSASGTVWTATVSGRTIGRASGFAVAGAGVLDGFTMGQLTFQNAVTGIFDFAAPLGAHAGDFAEEGWDRLQRLAVEEALDVEIVGFEDTEHLGEQLPRTLLDLLQEVADTDGGMLYEPRGNSELAYRTRASIGAQVPAVTVDYVGNMLLPFEPTEDDQDTTNRVTVSRVGGGSYTAEETAGALGSATVGLYDTAVTLSLAEDTDTHDQASWRLHAGTIDEARWPVIGIDLAHPTLLADGSLTRDVLTLDLGDRIVVNDLPAWLPPFSVDQLVQGYTERITPTRYKLTLNCTPAAVHQVGIYDHDASRYSGDGTVTAEALDTTETGVDVTCPTELRWGHDDGDYLIVIGGEVMTVTGVAGTGTAQTLTVTRSVNGVVKSHSIGAPVDLAAPSYYSL